MKKELIYVVALLAGLLIGCGIVTINILVMVFAFVLLSVNELSGYSPIAMLAVVLTMTVTIAALRSIPRSYDALFVDQKVEGSSPSRHPHEKAPLRRGAFCMPSER